MTDTPEWALREFCNRANLSYRVVFFESPPGAVIIRCAVMAGAKLLAQYEDQPDPVQEALREAYGGAAPEFVAAFKEALAARGYEVREANP